MIGGTWALRECTLAVAVTAAAGALSVLFAWYNQPWAAAGYVTPFSPRVFDLLGVAFAAWTLAAFAIGALAGMLIRRVVPAIAATLAAYVGLALAAGLFLREHYMTPLLTSNPNLPDSAWAVSRWYTKDASSGSRPEAPSSSTPSRNSAPDRRSMSRLPRLPSAWPGTGTHNGPATSPAAGSGPSSGSKAAGCSRCQCC